MRNPIAYHPSEFRVQTPSSNGFGRRLSPAWLTHRWELAFYIGLVLIALAMRVWELGDRAMHHDESLHALYSWYIVEGRGYSHDPLLHGPLQFHLNALVFFLFGDNDATARIAYALVGTGLVALPWLLRDWLGRLGAMSAATLLAFSPTLLYFSRFARNDILVAALTVGLVIVIWRYMRDRQPVSLYIAAALLALAFATKETVYITLFSIGAFLAFLSIGDVKDVVLGRLKLSEISAPASVLLVLFTLSLPLAAAASSVVQGPLGIVLLNEDPGAGRVGMPLDGGGYVAMAVTGVLAAVSAALGLAWDWRRWLLCAGIFWLIYVLLFTSFFSSPYGVVTGVWQSLGYWLAQQDVGRGGQPWYYYFVIGSNYEFLVAARGRWRRSVAPPARRRPGAVRRRMADARPRAQPRRLRIARAVRGLPYLLGCRQLHRLHDGGGEDAVAAGARHAAGGAAGGLRAWPACGVGALAHRPARRGLDRIAAGAAGAAARLPRALLRIARRHRRAGVPARLGAAVPPLRRNRGRLVLRDAHRHATRPGLRRAGVRSRVAGARRPRGGGRPRSTTARRRRRCWSTP